jgi:hypothetical protein
VLFESDELKVKDGLVVLEQSIHQPNESRIQLDMPINQPAIEIAEPIPTDSL